MISNDQAFTDAFALALQANKTRLTAHLRCKHDFPVNTCALCNGSRKATPRRVNSTPAKKTRKHAAPPAWTPDARAEDQWIGWREGYSGAWSLAHLSSGVMTRCGLMVSDGAVKAPSALTKCAECQRLSETKQPTEEEMTAQAAIMIPTWQQVIDATHTDAQDTEEELGGEK